MLSRRVYLGVVPNTGEPEARATTSRVATNRVYLDASRPSHVVLPIIPSRRGLQTG